MSVTRRGSRDKQTGAQPSQTQDAVPDTEMADPQDPTVEGTGPPLEEEGAANPPSVVESTDAGERAAQPHCAAQPHLLPETRGMEAQPQPPVLPVQNEAQPAHGTTAGLHRVRSGPRIRRLLSSQEAQPQRSSEAPPPPLDDDMQVVQKEAQPTHGKTAGLHNRSAAQPDVPSTPPQGDLGIDALLPGDTPTNRAGRRAQLLVKMHEVQAEIRAQKRIMQGFEEMLGPDWTVVRVVSRSDSALLLSELRVVLSYILPSLPLDSPRRPALVAPGAKSHLGILVIITQP